MKLSNSLAVMLAAVFLFAGCTDTVMSPEASSVTGPSAAVGGGPGAAGGPPAAVKGNCDVDVPDDYSTIQEAVDQAAAGDRVCVASRVVGFLPALLD